MTNKPIQSDSSQAQVVTQDAPESMEIPQVHPSLALAELHIELNRLTAAEGSEEEVRQQFRRLIQEHAKAVGVGHFVRRRDGSWELPENFATGRIPQREDIIARFASSCDETLQRKSIQVQHFLGLEVFYAPIQVFGASEEVLLLLSREQNSAEILYLLEIVTAYFGIWLKSRNAQRNDWKLTSLAALIELVSEIEEQKDLSAATQVVASELSRHLRCPHVAVVTRESQTSRQRLLLSAYSGSEKLEQSSQIAEDMCTAASESLLHKSLCRWPAVEEGVESESSQNGLRAHQQLAESLRSDSVMSIPLTSTAGETIGVLLMAGFPLGPTGKRLSNFARAAAPRIAAALSVVTRTQVSRPVAVARWLREQMRSVQGKCWALVVLVALSALWLPVPYRIRTACVVEATERRFVVAPFEGIVEEGFAEPGDPVQAGQLLAKMDDQEIRYRLIALRAEKQQASKQREIELAERKVSSSQLSELEKQRLDAQQDLLKYQQQQVELRSPIDGVVLSGSLERAHGMSVDLGKVLYEVGPLNPLKLQIEIPAEEVAQVQEGDQVRVWIRGLERENFLATIDRIRPQSELKNDRNVFVAEISVGNADGTLRPGMEGTVRIDCQPRSLGWNLFHKPWEYLVSRLTWW